MIGMSGSFSGRNAERAEREEPSESQGAANGLKHAEEGDHPALADDAEAIRDDQRNFTIPFQEHQSVVCGGNKARGNSTTETLQRVASSARRWAHPACGIARTCTSSALIKALLEAGVKRGTLFVVMPHERILTMSIKTGAHGKASSTMMSKESVINVFILNSASTPRKMTSELSCLST